MIPRDTRSGRYGYYPGNAAGTSLDFKDFRDYQPGDDLRHIDWGAYGRSDKLTVKLFREEVDPHVDLLIDGSRSMALEETAKARAVLGLAALLSSAASNAKCTCCSWIAADGCRQIENSEDRPSAWLGLNFDSRYSLSESFVICPPSLRRRGIRILLSDLLFPGDPFTALRHLAEGASAVFVIQVLADADINPPPRGNITIVDSETGETTELFLDEQIRKRYEKRLNTHQQNWHTAAKKTGTLITSFTAEEVVVNWNVDPMEAAGLLRGL
ncbi:DUF58 domain-containing protein [Desulfobacterales bacterium HSG2]|nr:DUF58 domain-containing protein [Desulfobacterales bacterium HSG2]